MAPSQNIWGAEKSNGELLALNIVGALLQVGVQQNPQSRINTHCAKFARLARARRRHRLH